MNIVKANAVYLDPNEMHPYAFMERVGRICYKSEDKITDESAVKFVNALRKNKHTAMLEHAHIILAIDYETAESFSELMASIAVDNNYQDMLTPYFHITINDSRANSGNYISSSFRTFINFVDANFNWSPTADKNLRSTLYDAYPEIFEKPDNYDGKTGCFRILSRDEFKNDVRKSYSDEKLQNNIISKHLVHTVLFTCDRGVSHEFVRHRPASFAQESTRYCNYSKDKFGNEITFIEPCYWDADSEQMKRWKISCDFAESEYFDLLILGATPQEARAVLPNSLKTELVITAPEIEWQHIINLREHGTTGTPHPQMKEVMSKASPQLRDKSDNRLK